jgi:hypothetical protein
MEDIPRLRLKDTDLVKYGKRIKETMLIKKTSLRKK